MSMTPEGDEFCIISAKKTKGNEQEEARRDGDDDDVVVRAVGFSSSMKHWASWTKGEDLEVRDEEDNDKKSLSSTRTSFLGMEPIRATRRWELSIESA